ncbi:hypothetical protein BDQ94DRAFT_136941 [Aspergillus welwitschiae]|uniref:Uncharacterized protein n=1 Tax=Aspergillus welwitschiae TaxID=1341132 RepID=A0A3F3QC94_9EURO|nr:hypothetical protein BDQ94DRAFT_136941 [Aspergillus welwitschiae]RDH36823.1 hypothetical protein BDQ94DRAFT_136941 [Aspergillus welwitschiae]
MRGEIKMAVCRTELFLLPRTTDQKEYRPNRISSPPLRRSQGSWWMMAPRRTSTTTEGLFGYDTHTNSPSSSSIPVGVIGPSGSINPPKKPILRLNTVFDAVCLACPFGCSPFSLCGNIPWKGNW